MIRLTVINELGSLYQLIIWLTVTISEFLAITIGQIKLPQVVINVRIASGDQRILGQWQNDMPIDSKMSWRHQSEQHPSIHGEYL